MGILKSISRAVTPDCEWRGSEHTWVDSEVYNTISICDSCGKVSSKRDTCDHEWESEGTETIHESYIQYNEYGYYVKESILERKRCNECKLSSREMIESNKVYFKIRERVPQ